MLKNIYSISKIYIPSQKYIFNLKNIYLCSKYIYLCSKNIYLISKIYIYVQKYIFDLKNIYLCSKIYI